MCSTPIKIIRRNEIRVKETPGQFLEGRICSAIVILILAFLQSNSKIQRRHSSKNNPPLQPLPHHISFATTTAFVVVDVVPSASTQLHLQFKSQHARTSQQLRPAVIAPPNSLPNLTTVINHSHEYQPPQPPGPPDQRQEAKDGARAGRGRHPHPGGYVSSFGVGIAARTRRRMIGFSSSASKNSHVSPTSILFCCIPFLAFPPFR